MDINKNCNLILDNLYFYDFRACYWNILKNIGYDLKDIEYENKEHRNIKLGLIQKNNPEISSFLINSSNNLVNHYIENNNICLDDIIIKQRDGFIITKKLSMLNDTQELELRGLISKLIITIDRKKFMSIYHNGHIEIKGISNKTSNLEFYNMFKFLDYSNRKNLIKGLSNIRKNILQSNNRTWFSYDSDNNMINVPIIGEGMLNISKSILNNIDINEIDKTYVWNDLVWPFIQSFLVHYHS